jgi:hypothetical protein
MIKLPASATTIVGIECVSPSKGVLVEVEIERDQKALNLKWTNCCHAIALLFRLFAGHGGAGFSEIFHLRPLEWRLTHRIDRMVG